MILFSVLLVANVLSAQNGNLEAGIEHVVPFKLFKTKKDTLKVQTLSRIDYHNIEKFGKTDPTYIYLAQLDFEGFEPLIKRDDNDWVLNIGYLNRANLFYWNGGAFDSITMGSFELNSNFTGKFSFGGEQLIDGRYLYLKFSKLNSRQNLEKGQFVFYGQGLENYQEEHISKLSAKTISYGYLLWGAVFVGVVISLIFYRTYRQPEYIYYSLYAVSLAIFLGRNGLGWYEKYIGNFSFSTFLLNNTFELLAGLFYVLFEKYFLDTQKQYPLLDKAINVSIAIFIVWLVVDTSVILMGKYHLHFVLLDIRALLLSVLVLFGVIYLLVNLRNQLNWFIITGSIIFALGSLLVYVSGDGNYLRLAAVAEITVFSLGLGYKVRVENREKISIEREISVTYLRLLRSQLNPHFVFNALGSIQHLIIRGEQSDAIYYLSNFSKLMRYVLESSNQQNVLLSEEISFLEKYVLLESLRFDMEFNFSIETDDSLVPEMVEVPLLLIQPFVENAIVHGLLPKKNGECYLKIHFKMVDSEILQCVVDDNGIGRMESQAQKVGRRSHKSYGISIVEKRLNALRQTGDQRQTVIIEDKFDMEGNSMGTKVTLNLFLNSISNF